MADQKIYEGRAELNIKPFLDALTKMETQSKATADSLTKIFQTLDAAINQSLAGIQATVKTVSANVTAVGRAVAQANGAVQQGQGAVKAIQAQGQAAQKASADNARAAQLEASARRQGYEQQLADLKRSLRDRELAEKEHHQQRLDTLKKLDQQGVEQLAITARQEIGVIQTKIREQQAIQDRARRMQATLAQNEARALRAGQTAGLPSAEAYERVAQAAQKAALTEASLQRQLTTVVRTEAAAQAKLGVEPWEKMNDAQLKFLRENGSFNQRFHAGLEQSRRELKKVEDSLNSIYRAGSQLMQLGSELTMIGGMLGYLGMGLAKNAGDFDFWLTRVSAAAKAAQVRTGEALDTTITKADNFRQRVLSIGEDVGILKPDEIAKGWYLYQSALGSAIKSTTDMADHQANVNELFRAAVITDTDFQTVIRGTTQAMAEFGMGATELPYALATMINITQVSQAEFSDMLQAFKMAGPQAKRLGMDIGDVAAAFAMLSDQGIRGTQAGRLFSSGLTNLVRPTEKMKDALQDLMVTQRGLTGSWEQFFYKNGQFVGLFDQLNEKGELLNKGALRQFHDATKNMSAAQREFYLASIFGKDAGKVWSTMVAEYSEAQRKAEAAGKQGVNSFELMARAMKDPQQQLKLFGDQWKDVSGSIKVQMGQAMFVFEQLRQQLGVIIAHNLIPFIKYLGGLAKGFMEWANTHPDVANGLVKVAIVITGLTLTLGPLLMMLGFIVQGFAALPTAFSALKMIGGGVIGMFGGLKAAIVAMVPALAGVSIPIWAIIAALVALYLAWRYNWGGMRDILGEVGNVIKGELLVLGKLLSGVLTLLTGLFEGKSELIRQGGREIAEALIEGLIVVPQRLAEILGGTINRLQNWANQLGINLRIWGRNMAVAIANGLIDGVRYVASAANTLAQTISRFFRSHSPPEYGPLKDITVWGRNLVQSLADGMNSADFDAIFSVADQVAEALKRNIEAGLTSPSTYAASMQQATGLVQEMLDIVRGGGRVNGDFFESLRDGLGEWYEYITKIALAYQDVYANERQLEIEKEKLEALREQREEVERQNQARQDAFDTYLKGTRPDNFQNNEANMVDPTTEEGRSKIEQMRRTLNAQEFQQWLQWQQKMWQDRADAEDRSLQAQEEAQQQVVDTYAAQVEAAKKQYELYQSMYEYAVKLYNLAEEQKQLEEQKAAAEAQKLDSTGTPEQVKQFLNEIAGTVGQDQTVLDEQRLKDQAGGDDIKALADATRQREREEGRLSELEKMNRRKRAEFEMAMINATSDEERNRIKQMKDAWDAAYDQEKARLQERVQMAREVQDAAEQMADASMAGRVAQEEARYYEEIKRLLGDQTDKILDANELKAAGGDLDQAAILARGQLRDEERKLRDLQAYGDQKKLEFEERIRQAAGDPEKLRRIKEEQDAWDTAYKRALEAQQLRVELARRAQQDIGDEASALEGGAGADGFSAPDFGTPGAGLDDFIKDSMPWLNDDGSINWDFLGLGDNTATGPRAAELQSVKLFDDLSRAIKFLGDESIPTRVKLNLLGESLKEALGWKDWGDALWPGASEDLAELWKTIQDDWERFKTGFSASFGTFWEWDVKPRWETFKGWMNENFGSGENSVPSMVGRGWERVIKWTDDTFGDNENSIPSRAGRGLQKAVQWVDDTFGSGENAIPQRAQRGLNRVIQWFADTFGQENENSIPNRAERGFRLVISKVVDFFTGPEGIITKFVNGFNDVVKKVVDFFTGPEGIDKKFSTGLRDLIQKVVDFFTGPDGIVTKFTNGLNDIVKKVVAFFTGEDGIVTKWNSFWGSIKEDWNSLVGTISSVLNPIISFVQALGRIRFPSMPDWLGGGGGGGDEGAPGAAQGLMTVPYDNFRAVLHAGERVLTAREAAFYNSLEGAMAQMAHVLSRAGTAQAPSGGVSKVVNINVAGIDASNPDEGRAFLNRLAFLS